jgi:thymidylate kinase
MSGRAKIVSFSGIDGAGKSTQIQALTNWLNAAGLTVRLLSFWDDVVMFSRFREGMSRRIFKGDSGIGSPEKPVNRRDKNVRSSPVTGARFFLYFCDALNLWRKVRSEKNGKADIVIFDRYIYDELANLPLQGGVTRIMISFLLRIIPAPDVAYVIDADPLAARQRKPEYPLEFIRENREAYLTLSHLIKGIRVIGPLPVEPMEQRVKEVLAEYLCSEPGTQRTANQAIIPSAH